MLPLQGFFNAFIYFRASIVRGAKFYWSRCIAKVMSRLSNHEQQASFSSIAADQNYFEVATPEPANDLVVENELNELQTIDEVVQEEKREEGLDWESGNTAAMLEAEPPSMDLVRIDTKSKNLLMVENTTE